MFNMQVWLGNNDRYHGWPCVFQYSEALVEIRFLEQSVIAQAFIKRGYHKNQFFMLANDLLVPFSFLIVSLSPRSVCSCNRNSNPLLAYFLRRTS